MKIHVLVLSQSEGGGLPPIPDISVFATRESLLKYLKDEYDIFEQGTTVFGDREDWAYGDDGTWQWVEDLEDNSNADERLTLETFDV